jgi:hypothetical protein
MRTYAKLISGSAILAAFILVGGVLALTAEAGRPQAAAGTGQAPTARLTQPDPFSATVVVSPSATELRVHQVLQVTVSITTSPGCSFPIFDLTLNQDVPIFEYTSPLTATVGPPVSNPFTYTLTAVSTGTVIFGALAYGERYCNDFFAWHYLSGGSMPVTVLAWEHQMYLPLMWTE